jgi:hypothetical protein
VSRCEYLMGFSKSTIKSGMLYPITPSPYHSIWHGKVMFSKWMPHRLVLEIVLVHT